VTAELCFIKAAEKRRKHVLVLSLLTDDEFIIIVGDVHVEELEQ